MSDLGDLIRAAVAAGSQVHVWPVPFGSGAASATVRAQGGVHHVERSGSDPVQALTAALVEEDRLRRDGRRVEVAGRDGQQMDIEDVVASGIEDMIG